MEDKDAVRNYRKMLKAIEEEAIEQMKSFADQFFGILETNELYVDDFSYKKDGVAGYFIKLQKGYTEDKIRGSRVLGCMEDASKWVGKTHKRRNEIIGWVERELIPL